MRNVQATDNATKRDVYFAFQIDEERIMVTANAVLLRRRENYFVDWLEVASEYRRQGFAMEFLEGLEMFLDSELVLTPGSTNGEAFLNVYCSDE